MNNLNWIVQEFRYGNWIEAAFFKTKDDAEDFIKSTLDMERQGHREFRIKSFNKNNLK